MSTDRERSQEIALDGHDIGRLSDRNERHDGVLDRGALRVVNESADLRVGKDDLDPRRQSASGRRDFDVDTRRRDAHRLAEHVDLPASGSWQSERELPVGVGLRFGTHVSVSAAKPEVGRQSVLTDLNLAANLHEVDLNGSELGAGLEIELLLGVGIAGPVLNEDRIGTPRDRGRGPAAVVRGLASRNLGQVARSDGPQNNRPRSARGIDRRVELNLQMQGA